MDSSPVRTHVVPQMGICFSCVQVCQPNISKPFRKYCSGQKQLWCDGQGTSEVAHIFR